MLPFFVYGTLLPGQPNYVLWGNAVEQVRPAWLTGALLYDMGAFPLMLESDKVDARVRGALVAVAPDAYETILKRLDALEQVNHEDPMLGPYRRVQRTVMVDGSEPQQAWTYVGNPRLITAQPLIPHGDWARHSAESMATILDWWRDYDNAPLQPPDPA